jgi:cell division protein FtsW (lipid II flippase)
VSRNFRVAGSLWCLLAPFPALIVGALIMRQHQVPPIRWLANLIAGVLSASICALYLARLRKETPATILNISAWIATAALGLTFVMAGAMGVHRWIHVGPLTLYAAAVFLPILIIALGAFDAFGGKPRWSLLTVGVAAAILALLQPDAAQATAFSGAACTLLVGSKRRSAAAWAAVVVIAVLAALTWTRVDPLPPVPYVEGILQLARQTGALRLATAVGGLAVSLLPFVIARRSCRSATPHALGVYFCVCMLTPLFGHFPVPLVGYGLSPIVGYFVGLASLGLCDRHS